jgi:hypothetical protein
MLSTQPVTLKALGLELQRLPTPLALPETLPLEALLSVTNGNSEVLHLGVIGSVFLLRSHPLFLTEKFSGAASSSSDILELKTAENNS